MALYGSYGYNYPTPPKKTLSYKSFPNDLTAPGRNFYTELTFMTYNVRQQMTASALFTPSGGVRLPIPRKLNDVQTLSWSPESGTSAAASILAGGLGGRAMATASALGGIGGAVAGVAVNPLLFMTFQKPNYKEHSLSWSLMPNTEQESRTIVDIVNYLKFNSLPRQDFGGALYRYPNILFVKLYPNDLFTMTFRPCAVTSVSVDYTGAGTPSFFKNGAPVVVNIGLNLTEIQLWDQTNYDGGPGISLTNNDTINWAAQAWTDLSKGVSDFFNKQE
jgi:hypothetical protein